MNRSALYSGTILQADKELGVAACSGSAALQRRVQALFLLSRADFSRREICGSDFFSKLFSRAANGPA